MGDEYVAAVELQKSKIADVSKTPSAQLVQLAKTKGYKKCST